MNSSLFKKAVALSLAAAVSLTGAAAMAQDHRDDHRDDHRRDDHRGPAIRDEHANWGADRHWGGPPHVVTIRPRPGYPYYRPGFVARTRWYHNIYINRPYGIAYPGFGYYYSDDNAFRFLGLTALSFYALNELNESQQRAHEQAMIEATEAPVGESIRWDVGGNSGSVTPVRDGQSADGRECREFQQTVEIGNRQQEAYGTACRQADGSWQVVNQG